MDPNENLKRQREIAAEIAALQDRRDEDGLLSLEDSDPITERASELAELVQALDAWLCRGGFKPSAWTVMGTAARGRMGHGD